MAFILHNPPTSPSWRSNITIVVLFQNHELDRIHLICSLWCVCVCVCNRPPICEVCMNCEVVVFQPWTVTPPHLGSVAYPYTFKLGLPPHLLLPFSGSFFFLLLPTASQSVDVHIQIPLFFSTSPHLLSRCKAPTTWASPVPTTYHLLRSYL